MKKLLFIIALQSLTLTFSQTVTRAELDSIYTVYISMHEDEKAVSEQTFDEEPVKCSFIPGAVLQQNIKFLSPEQQSVLEVLFARPNLDTSIVSPEGYFRIHFNKSGSAAPVYDIDQFALAADSSYDYEVGFLGYPPAPSDGVLGGDSLYDIYIVPLSYYGVTTADQNISEPNFGGFTSYIKIHNSFQGYPTTGLQAAQVTIAHEYHHAIQLGGYTFRSVDAYFYEISSTAMEEFVFDDVNDYYFYMSNYFERTDKTISATNGNGYDLAVWNIFLKDKLGFGVLKKQWELLPYMRAVEAIDSSVALQGENLRELYPEFGIWNFFTGYRAVPGSYYEEAANYPIVKEMETFEDSRQFTFFTQPLANSYLKYIVSRGGSYDTAYAIISNVDVQSAVDKPLARFDITYGLYSAPINGTWQLENNYYYKIETDKPQLWRENVIANNVLLSETGSYIQTENKIFPSPYKYSAHSGVSILIPIDPAQAEFAYFNVYNISMDLVFQKRYSLSKGQTSIMWDPLSTGERLATGVYLYLMEVDGKISKGKLVIIND